MYEHLHGALPGRRTASCAAVLIATAMFAVGLFGDSQPAAAQQGFGNIFGYQTQQRPKRRSARRARPAAPKEQTAEKKAKETEKKAPTDPVYVVISLGDQHISVYDANGRIARSRVSTGMRGHPTPTGVFSVIGKERYHRSNLYGGAPMPWMQRITWSGVAMHAGVVPGYPASHGCIRLPYSFAPQLWGMTKMGARVVVARRDTVPFEIAHSFLPLPKMHTPPVLADVDSKPPLPEAPVELASMETPATLAATDLGTDKAGMKPLDPITYAAALKEHAKAEKTAAEKVAKEALEAAQAAGAEARQAVDDVRKAEAELKAAEATVAELEAKAAKATEASDAAVDAGAAEAAATARTAAQSEFIRARAALEAAQRREAVKTPAAFAAVAAWKEAAAASEAAEQTYKEANRRLEPVSILISRKEGRVFIRQDWKEVYEAPVTIRDPDRPLGTHIYIAVAAEPDGSAMRWSAISVPPEAASSEGRRNKKGKAAEETPSPVAPETAAGALDRIEISPEVRERIAELLWTGASLIVSDHGRSYEMSEYSDFIILTR